MIHEQKIENLSINISTLRKSKSWTQAQLAKTAQVPRSTIANIESGNTNPTFANIFAIAGALQVSIDELIADPRGEYKLVKAADVPQLSKSGGKVVMHKLLPDPIHGMEIDRLILAPNSRMKGVPHLAHTKEYITCIQGQVTVYSAGEKFELSKDDVLAFPGDLPHSYFNPGRSDAICLSVVVLKR